MPNLGTDQACGRLLSLSPGRSDLGQGEKRTPRPPKTIQWEASRLTKSSYGSHLGTATQVKPSLNLAHGQHALAYRRDVPGKKQLGMEWR